MHYIPVIRAGLLFFGAFMLLFSLWNLLAPSPHFVSATPQPGAVLATSPEAVTIKLDGELGPESNISVASSITLSPTGEEIYANGKSFIAKGPDPSDPQKQTLRVDLAPDLPKGLYWARWSARAAGRNRTGSSGVYCFTIGMPIPEYVTRDMPGAIEERDGRVRKNRKALVGGVLLLVFAFVLPRLKRFN